MLSRRDVALGGLLTIGWLAGTCSCASAHEETPRRFGCMLSDGEADALLANSSGSSDLFADGRTPTLVSSGNREFDYALAQTLSRMTDAFGVLPGFAYFDDSAGMNAHATTRQMLSRSDGTVLFGRRLLDTLLARREHPDVAVSAVCAHEFGHIAQYKIGIHKQLREGEETARRLELHADFLAGYFAGYRKLQKPGLSGGRLRDDAVFRRRLSHRQSEAPRPSGRARSSRGEGFRDGVSRSPLDERGDADRLQLRQERLTSLSTLAYLSLPRT